MPRIRLVSALTATGLALLPSACGGATRHHPDPARSRPQSVRHQQARSLPQQYTDCMRAHGIHDFPEPVDGHISLTPGIDTSSRRFKAAAHACAKYAPGRSTTPGAATTPGATTTNGAATTTASHPWRAYSRWLAARARAGQFSGSVLVATPHRTWLDAGFGLSDRSSKAANTPRTRFCIASIGKLFTAISVAQLAERHELSFDAPVGRYVRGLPAAIGTHITIAELLDMTSGLGNVVLGRRRPPTTLAGQVALIAGERPQFTPGRRFLYSNDGYILLGAVVQRVSGESYARYVGRHVFAPAHMTHTGYRVYVPADVDGMAHGYALAGTTLRDISEMPQIANPSGGAYSTTGDLLRFARALLAHRLLGAGMTRTILVPRVNSPQPGGPPVDEYTYGFAYQRIHGVTFVGHNGGTPGYEGQLDVYPRTGRVVVVLTNQDQTMIPAIQRSEAIATGEAAS
ncbi:MAG TPA: serine hydrolase domain-containing protein [Solirubrobacteraceae bacterium]|nr:serine hydrolase domain-containing protein [Solirubrobacteraceae bacterium]